MSEKIFFKSHKIGLAIFAVGFIFFSFAVHGSENYLLFRFLRGFICLAALVYLLIALGRKNQKWIVGFLFFYGASSIATVWYENSIMAAGSMILNLVAFCMLLSYVVPKFELKNLTKTFALLFVLTMAINGYLLFQLIGLMKAMTLSQTQYIFMVLCTICVVLLGFLALFHNHYDNTPQSMAFTLLVFLIIFAEVFRGIGYYNLAYSVHFVYLARIFLVLAICVCVHFSFLVLHNPRG